jgi:hypothetical protein
MVARTVFKLPNKLALKDMSYDCECALLPRIIHVCRCAGFLVHDSDSRILLLFRSVDSTFMEAFR